MDLAHIFFGGSDLKNIGVQQCKQCKQCKFPGRICWMFSFTYILSPFFASWYGAVPRTHPTQPKFLLKNLFNLTWFHQIKRKNGMKPWNTGVVYQQILGWCIKHGGLPTNSLCLILTDEVCGKKLHVLAGSDLGEQPKNRRCVSYYPAICHG